MIRIATWNVNHRVGLTTFRPEAPMAATHLAADVVAFTEFYPGKNEESFRESLAVGGLTHQAISTAPPIGVRANRVLVASRLPIERLHLDAPALDNHLPANVIAVRLPQLGLNIVGVSVPWYEGADLPKVLVAWEWLEKLAAEYRESRCVIMGDLNVSPGSRPARGGINFGRILENGWTKVSAGPTFVSGSRASEIDHILATRRCALSNAVVVTRAGGYELAGPSTAISDHAALMCDVTVG